MRWSRWPTWLPTRVGLHPHTSFLPCRCERASEAQKKADAEAEQAEAEKRQVRAKAQAAAACAEAMYEIVGDSPKAMDLDGGVKQAGDNVAALVPKCKDSIASAGG